MASIQRHGKRWRVQVYVNGKRESATFETRLQAAAWATEREAMLGGRRLPNRTFGDAMRRFGETVSPGRKGARWEINRLDRMRRDIVATVALAALSPADISDYRDRRMQAVSGSSVRREMVLLSSVIEMARKEWGWIRVNPMRDVRKPKIPPSRKRRITDDEVRRLKMAFGLSEGLSAETSMQRVGLAFLFALETAMRAGEMLGLTWEHVHLMHRYVHLTDTKNNDTRDVPLSSRAVEILQVLNHQEDEGGSPVFRLNSGTRDTLFRRARNACMIQDLHFHDARAEAIWRLSKKLDVLDLARVIGHRDLKSLMIYYNANASELAKRLG